MRRLGFVQVHRMRDSRCGYTNKSLVAQPNSNKLMKINTLATSALTVLLAITSINALAAENKSSNTGVDVAKAPGENFDLSGYKLQLPVANGHSVVEVAPAMLRDYESNYFYTDKSSGAMVFSCPSNGATTRGSHYPRTELRSLSEWNFTDSHSLTATLAVTQQPDNRDLIVGQIHGDGKGSEALKLRWHNGDIVAGVKTSLNTTEIRSTIAKGIALGEQFTYSIVQQDHAVTVTVNGASQSFTYDASWDNETVYFKAGNYLQDNSTSGANGVVFFYKLN
ncbi:Alginate lyase [Solimicrobium silvestre]|uniref:Alginate lyase n=2 Tax=Solimicrobium silvestre TaxID=2099400 RepID=A0A2S9H4B3_9BURK|nr:Alginate lyase [Solimicrobium silvestre]